MTPNETGIRDRVRQWKKLLPFPLAVAALLLGGRAVCGRVPKPEQNGPGPVAYETNRKLDAPEYHNPADWWRAHHPVLMRKGDFELRDCAECHAAESHCNRCHAYIGARRQALPHVPMKEPLESRK